MGKFNSDNDNWCSPSNCYEGWHYLDKYGVIHDFISASVVAAKTSQNILMEIAFMTKQNTI